MFFVHVVGGQDACRRAPCADVFGAAFDVDDFRQTALAHAQFFRRHGHIKAEPFAVARVAEHGKVGRFRPRIFRRRAVAFDQSVKQGCSVHGVSFFNSGLRFGVDIHTRLLSFQTTSHFSCFFNNTHARIRLVAAKAAMAAYSCSRSAVCSPLVKLPTLTV